MYHINSTNMHETIEIKNGNMHTNNEKKMISTSLSYSMSTNFRLDLIEPSARDVAGVNSFL